MTRVRLCILSATLALAAGDSLAADGIIEINAAVAQAGGMSGSSLDAPGYPVLITQPGSYRLTGNLTVDQNTTAILVQASDVDIDLAGFTILGPNHCTVSRSALGFITNMNCTYANGSGSGVGIAGQPTHIRVHNGTIAGMGGYGAFLNGGRAEDLVLHDNSIGVYTLGGSVRRIEARDNYGTGIAAREVSDCIAERNIRGILLQVDGASVSDSSAVDNATGIEVNPELALIRGSRIERNGIGISAGHASLVDDLITDNGGCGAQFSAGTDRSGAIGGNSFLGNNVAGTCSGSGGQNQFAGKVLATACNVVTCAGATPDVGTFCPSTFSTCQPF